MLKGCIFDFDGVIMDTEKYHFLAWKEAFNTVNYLLTYSEYEYLKSTGKEHIINYVQNKIGKSFSEEIISDLANIKDTHFKRNIENISQQDFLPGVLSFIKLLRLKSVKVAVASSSVMARHLIEQFLIIDLFDSIIDGNNKCPKKPEPDIFLLAINQLGIKPCECIIFEDSLVGLEAAKNAGIESVFVGELIEDYSKFSITNFLNSVELVKKLETFCDK